MVLVAGRPAARGTWHVPPCEGLPKIFSRPWRSNGGESLNPNSQVTRVLYQLKIHWGCRFCGVPAARARGEEDVLTWGPPVKVYLELATPDSVPGCTLARSTWRRMKKGPRGLGPRVHVQCTCKWFAHFKIRTHLQVKREAPMIPNSQVTFILCQLKIHWGCHPGGV